jgi:hypothetical protein
MRLKLLQKPLHSHYLQLPSYGKNQDAPQLMNGPRKHGIYTQWNFT